jgi:hypothetical protein
MDFHLIMPRDMTLDEGHHEVKELENIFKMHFDDLVDILIHLDPCSDGECPICGHNPCILRSDSTNYQHLWHRDQVTVDLQNRVSELAEGSKT